MGGGTAYGAVFAVDEPVGELGDDAVRAEAPDVDVGFRGLFGVLLGLAEDFVGGADLLIEGVTAPGGFELLFDEVEGGGEFAAGFLRAAGGFQACGKVRAALRKGVEPLLGVGEGFGELLALAVECGQFCRVALEGGLVGQQCLDSAGFGVQLLGGVSEADGVEGCVFGWQQGAGAAVVVQGTGVLEVGGVCGLQDGVQLLGFDGAVAAVGEVVVVGGLLVKQVEVVCGGAVGLLETVEVADGLFCQAGFGQLLCGGLGGGVGGVLAGEGLVVQGGGPGAGGCGEGGGVVGPGGVLGWFEVVAELPAGCVRPGAGRRRGPRRASWR